MDYSDWFRVFKFEHVACRKTFARFLKKRFLTVLFFISKINDVMLMYAVESL